LGRRPRGSRPSRDLSERERVYRSPIYTARKRAKVRERAVKAGNAKRSGRMDERELVGGIGVIDDFLEGSFWYGVELSIGCQHKDAGEKERSEHGG
jgi:hypothetical protein